MASWPVLAWRTVYPALSSTEPAVRRTVSSSSTTSIVPVPAAGTGTILVVDDEETVRRTAGSVLERAGYTVLHASTGQEAIAVYEQQRSNIVLVVLDMTMPVMSGEKALR